ncbi:MAG: hypothetical protein WC004_05270 [Candidatus Absconditabacterales bacterium]
MKKVFQLGMLVFGFAVIAGCTKSIVVTDDMLSGSITTGGVADSTGVDVATGAGLATGPIAADPVAIQGVGTEPFWAFAFTGDTMVRSAPDNTGVSHTTYTGITQVVVSGTTTIYSDLANLTILKVAPGTCSDGMSDIVYPGTVEATVGGQTYNGCVK